MTVSEFKRWLAKQGATFGDGTNHEKVFLNGKQTVLPRHAKQELGTWLENKIKKQLGLK